MKFNGKQTGSHKANNAQRLTEVKYFETHISSNLCLLCQLFSSNHCLVQLFSLIASSFNFSRAQVRFAAAAIGNEEMACPAADREISNYDRETSNYDRETSNYDREITNQIVVD